MLGHPWSAQLKHHLSVDILPVLLPVVVVTMESDAGIVLPMENKGGTGMAGEEQRWRVWSWEQGQQGSRTAGQWSNIVIILLMIPGQQEMRALLRDGLWVPARGSRWMCSLQGCLHRCCFEKQMLLFIKYFASIS